MNISQILKSFFIFCFFFSANVYASVIETEALSAHNKFRALHHAPALVWDAELANYANDYAQRCQFKHSSSPYGENLATGYPSIAAAVKIWYDENSHYSYNHPGYSSQTGHFTQVVWKDSKKLGCAYVACNGKNGTPGKFLVCEYSPHGNVVSRKYFENNVLPM
jgi:uncharacterized protein YkwD